jgi:thiamine kinase-like enzyme
MHEEITIPELTEVVARLSALLGPREGGVAPLEGGITNRNYRVNFGGSDYVVRLPGKRSDLLGIDRAAECIANKQAAELGIAPAVATMLERPSCLVTGFIRGREMPADELRQPARVEEIGADLRRLHDSGVELPTNFDPLTLAEGYARLAREHGAAIPEGFDAACETARAIQARVAGQEEHTPVPCHNDLLPTNFMYDGERVQIIDWEYAGMGDRYFDLGNFAVNNEFDDAAERILLEAYFGEPPDERRSATLKLFRFVSDLREAMWGVLQSGISELDFDFVEYGRKHFARLVEAQADPRFRGWIEAARG